MANKKTLQRLRLDPYFSKTIATNLNVWSHDINSYEIKFEFYDHQCDKPIDLTGSDMRILLDHQGSQPKIYPLEIESKVLGLAKFIMPEQIRGCEGKFTAHIYADYPNKTHDFGSFTFYTQLSRIDGNMGGCMDEIYVSEFEKALKEIKDKSTQFDGVEKELNERINELNAKIDEKEVYTFEDKPDIVSTVLSGANHGTPPKNYKKGEIWYFDERDYYEGMNVFKDTKNTWINGEKNDKTTSKPVKVDLLSLNHLRGKEVEISCFVRAENVTPGLNNRLGIEMSFKYSDGTVQYINAWRNISSGNTNEIVRKTFFIKNMEIVSVEGAGLINQAITGSWGLSQPMLQSKKAQPFRPNPAEIVSPDGFAKAIRDNTFLDLNDFEKYQGETLKPNVIDLQKQVDELKKAITTLGGTL